MRYVTNWMVSIPSLLLIRYVQAQALTGLPTLTGTTDNAIPTAAGSTAQSDSTAATTSGSSGSISSITGLPTLRGSSDSSGGIPTLTGLPTLSGAFSYPPPTVPPTANAPYMQRSTLPEGTVFICIGAGLAFIGAVIVLWRLITRWMINRSVKRAAMSAYANDTKAYIDADRKARFYTQSPDSGMSMERLTKTGRPMSTAPTKTTTTPNASLFFSPTAGGGIHNTNRQTSGYLPAGYYNLGNTGPGNDAGTPPVPIAGGRGSAVPNRRPVSEFVPPSSIPYEDSPTASPDPPFARHTRNRSTGSLSTGVGGALPGQRAPSHLLDDLVSAPPMPPVPPMPPKKDYKR